MRPVRIIVANHTYVCAFQHERQSAWLQGLEGAFRHFGGVPREVLVDNAGALVTKHDARTREITFNDRFHAFCRYWGVTPRACAPYRARTKGKDERGVGYVKGNAIAGHGFASVEQLQAHLLRWMREIADVRIHGTTAEAPLARFERDERAALPPLAARAPFLQVRELSRRVHSIVGSYMAGVTRLPTNEAPLPPMPQPPPSELLRPLSEYEMAVGGGW